MEKEKFMYILEKGYWTLTDLKTKAMRAAYEEAKKHDRKIVYPDEVVNALKKIMDDAVFAAAGSGGVKMPQIYRLNNEIRMEDNMLIRAEKLPVERHTPRCVINTETKIQTTIN